MEAQPPVIVTLEVANAEVYRILMTEEDDIRIARDLLAGKQAPGIPNGRVIYGHNGGVNRGYNWSIDSSDVEWAEAAIELCDGLPSAV